MSWTLTQMRPSATATERGAPPTWIVFATWFVRGSIRETVPERLFATHTAPAPTARPDGSRPTAITASTARVEGLIRDTVPSWLLATQIAASPAAIGPGPFPSGIVSVIAPAPAGAILLTVLSVLSATHTAPSPIAIPVGLLPTSTLARTRLLAVSISKTAASAALATHREFRPSAATLGVPDRMPDEAAGKRTTSATAPTSASRRTARPRLPSAIQAEPAPTASPATLSPVTIAAWARRVAMSIWETVPSATLATQM